MLVVGPLDEVSVDLLGRIAEAPLRSLDAEGRHDDLVQLRPLGELEVQRDYLAGARGGRQFDDRVPRKASANEVRLRARRDVLDHVPSFRVGGGPDAEFLDVDVCSRERDLRLRVCDDPRDGGVLGDREGGEQQRDPQERLVQQRASHVRWVVDQVVKTLTPADDHAEAKLLRYLTPVCS